MKQKRYIINVFIAIMVVCLLVMLTGCNNKDNRNNEEKNDDGIISSNEVGAKYNEIFNNYFNGIETTNIDMYRKAFTNVYVENEDIKEEDLQVILENLKSTYGDNIKIEYLVTEETAIDKEGLKIIKEYIASRYKKEVEVRAGYKLKIKITLKGDKYSEDLSSTSYVYEIDEKMGILNISLKEAKSYLGYPDEDESSEDNETVNLEYKDAINNYFSGVENADLNVYLSAFPKFYRVEIADMSDQSTMDELLKGIEKKCGSNVKVTYNVIEENKYSSGELENMRKFIEYMFSENVNLTDAYHLKLEVTAKGDDGSNVTTEEIYVYQINGSWGILYYTPEDAKEFLEE